MIVRLSRLIVMLAFCLACCGQLRAQDLDPAYLGEMPSVERVLAKIQGNNPRDTAARQMGAFYHLRRMVTRLSGGREFKNQLTSDEQRLLSEYAAARGAIASRIEASLSQGDRASWFAERERFELSEDYPDEVLGTFFSKPWAEDYLEVTIGDAQQRRRSIERSYGVGWSSTAFELLPSVRRSLLAQLAGALLLVLFSLWRETRPFAADAKDPTLLRAGLWGRHRISTVHGKASDVNSRTYEIETRRSDTDGNVSILRSLERTQSFKVRSNDRVLEFPESKSYLLSVEEGAQMSAALLTKPGATRSHYLRLMNHANNFGHWFDEPILGYLKPWLWPAAAWVWLILTSVRFTRLSEGGEAVQGFIGLILFSVCVGYFIWRHRTGQRRLARFHATTGSALQDRMNAEARDPSSVGTGC